MKVFLSSTYVDLMEHRRQAAEVLERLGQQAGRMEVFGARAFWRQQRRSESECDCAGSIPPAVAGGTDPPAQR
jgi:hypothetical protein